jgi:hypothetical protein
MFNFMPCFIAMQQAQKQHTSTAVMSAYTVTTNTIPYQHQKNKRFQPHRISNLLVSSRDLEQIIVRCVASLLWTALLCSAHIIHQRVSEQIIESVDHDENTISLGVTALDGCIVSGDDHGFQVRSILKAECFFSFSAHYRSCTFFKSCCEAECRKFPWCPSWRQHTTPHRLQP